MMQKTLKNAYNVTFIANNEYLSHFAAVKLEQKLSVYLGLNGTLTTHNSS